MDLKDQEQAPTLQSYPIVPPHVLRKEAGPLIKMINRMMKPKIKMKPSKIRSPKRKKTTFY